MSSNVLVHIIGDRAERAGSQAKLESGQRDRAHRQVFARKSHDLSVDHGHRLVLGGRIEIGLVPFGAAGLVVFSLHLAFAGVAPHETAAGLHGFVALDGSWRVLADPGLIGLFGGFYIVPLYALIRERAPRERLSRIVAANSVINALFMVLASLYAVAALQLGLSIPQLFLTTAIMTAAVVAFRFKLVPEFTMRFIIWLLVSTIYRVRKRALENIPKEGGVPRFSIGSMAWHDRTWLRACGCAGDPACAR